MLAYKAAKDRLTLLFANNASRGRKLKPLLVYHSKNPEPLETCPRVVFLLHRGANPKPALHRPFSGFSSPPLHPRSRKYFLEKDVSFNILLMFDSALGYPHL